MPERSEREQAAREELLRVAATLYAHVEPHACETRAGIAVSEARALIEAANATHTRAREDEQATARGEPTNAEWEQAFGTVEEQEHPESAAEARAAREDAEAEEGEASTPADKPARLRVRVNFGPCRVLGEFLRETNTGFSYVDEATGRTRRVARTRRRRFAGECAPSPHTAPCGNCPERRDPRACLHGRVGMCETCMST